MMNERGMTIPELLVVLALAAAVFLLAGSYALPWVQQQTMQSAVYDVQSHLQLARVEAITRNRTCRFEVDTATRLVRVFDVMDPADLTDDVLLHSSQLDTDVAFSDPEGGDAVTLSQIGTTTAYEAWFRSDGVVTVGVGDIRLLGGQRYNRVSVFGAGGTQVDRWNNGGWHVGS